jgi:hypothetical protein
MPVMATLQERRLGYHSQAGLEPGTSRFSTLRLNHYAARGCTVCVCVCVRVCVLAARAAISNLTPLAPYPTPVCEISQTAGSACAYGSKREQMRSKRQANRLLRVCAAGHVMRTKRRSKRRVRTRSQRQASSPPRVPYHCKCRGGGRRLWYSRLSGYLSGV